MNIAYVRVSTAEQNEARQVEALEKYKIEKWFKEKVSAKDTHRPELQNLIEFAREGDTVYVHDFSRLARTIKDLLTLVETFNEKGIILISNKENIDTSSPTGRLMLTMIGAINEFERTNMLERQREGIAIAKKAGVYKGRRPKQIKDFDVFYQKYVRREINKVQFAKAIGVSRVTLDKLLKEYVLEQTNSKKIALA